MTGQIRIYGAQAIMTQELKEGLIEVGVCDGKITFVKLHHGESNKQECEQFEVTLAWLLGTTEQIYTHKK